MAVVDEEEEIDAGGVCQRSIILDLGPLGLQRPREQARRLALCSGQFAGRQLGDARVIGNEYQAPRLRAHLLGQLRADRPLRAAQVAPAVGRTRTQVQQQGAVEFFGAGLGQGHRQTGLAR
ncbi:hypothetical protein D3C85_1508760 [compost metagenome]